MEIGYTAEDQQIIANAKWEHSQADASKGIGVLGSHGFQACAFTEDANVTEELLLRAGLLNDGPDRIVANKYGAAVMGDKNIGRLRQLEADLVPDQANREHLRNTKPRQREIG